jgi:hypothetical protein
METVGNFHFFSSFDVILHFYGPQPRELSLKKGVVLARTRSNLRYGTLCCLFWAFGILIISRDLARAEVILAPHRAVYSLNLIENSNHGSWESVVGRMVYELTGSPCEGYQQQFRQMIILSNSEGGRQLLDDYSSVNEASDEKRLDFFAKNIGKDEVVETINGSAQRLENGVIVHYTSPTRSELHLPAQTTFPISYTKSLITAALAGRKSLDLLQFDGTENTSAAQRTFAIIGAEKSLKSSSEIDLVTKIFGKQRHWPVTIGFGYEDQLSSEYSIFQEILENGVAVNLILDLKEFKLGGHLQNITKLDEKKCN